MDKSFLTVFIAPKEWAICGYKLKPYSLRTHFNLVAVESPYAVGAVPTPMETIEFLRYCSQGDVNAVEMRPPTLRDYYFYTRLSLDVKLHIETIRKITIYIKEYTRIPSFRIKSPSAEIDKSMQKIEDVVAEKTIPELMTMMCVCMQKANLSESEVMSMPIGKVAWYAATIAAIEGGRVTIEEELEKEDAEQVKKAMDEEAEKAAARMRQAMADGKIRRRTVKVE